MLKFVFIIAFFYLALNSLSQTEIAVNSFEQNATDTWQPIVFSTPPCTIGTDNWNYSTTLVNITPNHLNQFWGIRDLLGDCGSSTGETLTFPTVNTSLHTNITLSFDYYVFEFDNGDDLFYTLTLDGITQNEIQFFDGSGNLSTNGWVSLTLQIPAGTASVGFQLRVNQNGTGDYAGIDHVRLEGDLASSCFIQQSGLTSILCNDNGTALDFTDDFITFSLQPTGGNLSNSYSISTNPTNVTPNTNINYTTPTTFTLNNGSANNGDIVVIITDAVDQQCTLSDTLANPGYCSTGYSLTINSVSALTYNVNCNAGENGSLSFSSTGNFAQNNTYFVELSDENGTFNTPNLIGQLTTSLNNGTINYTIPAGTISGNGYRIRITSNQPNLISTDNGSNIVISLDASNCSQPYMTSLLSNSCTANNCPEGYNELIFLNSGVGFTANTSSFTLTYGNNSGIPYDFDYTDVLTPNATKIAELNTAAGCTGLFIDGTNQPIPANAQIIFANTNLCDDALDWTGLCGQGPIYMVFNNDSEWNSSGNFVNGTNNGNRYINIIVTDNLGNTTTTEYWFNTANNSGSDGDFQNYSAQGGEAIFYGNQGCMINAITLPVELVDFKVLINRELNTLKWKTLSGHNNAYFELERKRKDESTWDVMYTVSGAGHSSETIQYTFNDDDRKDILNYYRLKQVDFNGEFRYSPIISADNRLDNKIIGVFDFLGRPINPDALGLKIIQFEDGTTLKVTGNISNY